MKSLYHALPVWLLLGGFSWSLATANDGDLTGPIAACAILAVLLLVAWLTFISAADDFDASRGRIFVLTITVLAWAATFIIAQGRIESHQADQRALLLAFGLAAPLAAGVMVKTRSYPRWSTLRGVAITLSIPALAGGIFLWCYEAKTKSIAVRAEARWNEIGLPLAEFERKFVASQENAGSKVLRKVLREEIGSHFYKDGTRATVQEPVLGISEKAELLVTQGVKLLQDHPPADDIDLSHQSVDLLEATAAELDSNYRQILAAEPPIWHMDLHEGYDVNVPNFLGIRKFALVTAADALRRFSEGDPEGAARALRAGLRVGDGVRQNPSLVALMISIAVDALLSEKQVHLPSSEDSFQVLARDTAMYRAKLLQSMQYEAWGLLRFPNQAADRLAADLQSKVAFLPRWAVLSVVRPWARRQAAIAALDDAEHTVIAKSVETWSLPDLGASRHAAVSEANPSSMEINIARATMLVYATLILREQTELIRDARTRLAEGRPLIGRDSVVLTHLRWELTTDAAKSSVNTRLVGAPEWIVKTETSGIFWTLPLDGSVAWQFHKPLRTSNR
jgi:hypothetical protein